MHDVHGDRLTFAELYTLSLQFADLLNEMDLHKGDRIIVQANKNIGHIALYLAALRIGIIFIPLNPNYSAGEMQFFLQKTSPALLVIDDVSADFSGKIAILGNGEAQGLWKEAKSRKISTSRPIAVTAEDPAAIVFTSGTTGTPKGAILSQGALFHNAQALTKIWAIHDQDCLLHALPLFHVHGLFIAMNSLLLAGAEQWLLPKFTAKQVAVNLGHATMFMGVPTYYHRLLQETQLGKKDLDQVRLFISGSAPLTPKLFAAFKERFGKPILERYGMSEAGVIASNPLDEKDRQASTVGYALPDTKIRIADNSGEQRPPNEIGNVEIKSPSLFSGYWQEPKKTAEEFTPDGYFKTGDLGSLSPDGRLTLVGRAKDLVISGGLNIYPKEIERILDEIDAVEESAVIGLPDPDFGEKLVAILVAKSDPIPNDILLKALEGKLARFKRPKAFHWLPELPRNAMGKVQKNLLRQQFAAGHLM